jgi:hypothetical protein
MLIFDSFEELKKFMDTALTSLRSRTLRPLPPPDADALGHAEINIIKNIYKSYKEDGKKIRQIAGNFLHLMQLLVPARNFTDIFKHLIYLEWMEHTIQPEPGKKFYRDHILHCANVCWVGDRLLSEPMEPFYPHVKSCLKNILPAECKRLLVDDAAWESFIKITWYITAMVHDFGYPIELVERKYAGNELYVCSENYLKTNRLTDYFKKHLSKTASLFKKQAEKIDKKMLKNPFRHCDVCHPILGSLELLHFLKDNYRQFSGGKVLYRYIYQLAALGIFEHHKEGEIDFDLNPFGYILVLADTLHEWHRYVCTGTARAGSTKLGFISPITKVTVKREGPNLYKVLYKVNPHRRKCKGWKPDTFKKSKKEELERLKFKTGLPQFRL